MPWDEMSQAPLLQKLCYFFLTLLFGFLASLYFQIRFLNTLNIGHAVYAMIGSFMMGFRLLGIWWGYQSAMFAGFLGAAAWTYRTN